MDLIENHADGEYLIYIIGNKVDLLESDEYVIDEEV